MKDTIEEAAEEYAHKSFVYPLNTFGEPLAIPPGQTVPMGYTKHCKVAKKHFIAGAQWKDERMYSEENIIAYSVWFHDNCIYYDGWHIRDPLGDVYDEIYTLEEIFKIYRKEILKQQ